MPSFDVVSRVNWQEISNAVSQAQKEVAQRYDFKNSKSSIELAEKEKVIRLVSVDEFKLKALVEIVQGKLVRRNISLKNVTPGKVESSLGGLVKQSLEIKEGIDSENAKAIAKAVRDSKIKVQAQIQGEELRVTGKKRDDLQETIALIKGLPVPLECQFVNFRD